MKRSLAITGLLALLAAAPALGQPAVEITPTMGVYIPTGNLVEQQIYVDNDAVTAELDHKSGLAIGGRVTVWLPTGIGLEGSYLYAMSDARESASFGGLSGSASEDAHVGLGAAKLLYKLGAVPAAPMTFHLGVGLAVISHGGKYWDLVNVDGTTDVGGVIGLGASLHLPGMVAIRVDAEDYIYSAKFDEQGAETDSKMQNDLMLTVGLAIKLGP